jgi:hypothetical protein
MCLTSRWLAMDFRVCSLQRERVLQNRCLAFVVLVTILKNVSTLKYLSVKIGNHYFPPDCNVTIIDYYLKFLEQILNARQYRVIMLGNFSVPIYEWNNGAPFPSS